MKHLNHLQIPLQVIKRCTEDFNETKFIGKGGYGRVYKGILYWANHENRPVAVKRLDVTSGQGKDEFHIEVKMLSSCRHKNIITLIGFCNDNNEMIIVYEYASHGSLSKYLSHASLLDELPWQRRLEICIDVASALEYLHNHVATNHRIIHRDIKSSNILLDDNRNAKLSDFGLSRMGPTNQQDTMLMTNPAGTYGYVDPLYARVGILTKESDVYSFGVVLFEVLCGRPAIVSNYSEEQKCLDRLARKSYENGELDKIIDERIKEHIKPRVLTKVSDIAYQCLQETTEKRPTIDEVTLQLKEAIKIQVKATGDDEATVLEISHHPARQPPSGCWCSTISFCIRKTISFCIRKRKLLLLFILCLVVVILFLIFGLRIFRS